MRYFVCLLVLVVSVQCQLDVHPCTGRVAGFARDLNSCNHFWRCGANPSTRGACPNGNRFDAETERCVQPQHSNCFSCPTDTAYKQLSVPRACNQFIRCFHGRATLHACPHGLVFDGRTGIHNCNVRPLAGGCHRENDLHDEPMGLCPGVIGNRPLFLRDHTDCARGFICARPNQSPKQTACQNDLHFSIRTGLCDTPENVHCDWETPEAPQDQPGPAIACPPGGGVAVPCRVTCNRYYVCTRGGQSNLHLCGGNTVFDHVTRKCVDNSMGRCWADDHGKSRPTWRSKNPNSNSTETVGEY